MFNKLKAAWKELTLGGKVAFTLAHLAFAGVAGLFVYTVYDSYASKGDSKYDSVMILNSKANHGGSGFVIGHKGSTTQVLTNAHVCGVVREGGMIRHQGRDYQVTSYLMSELYDLCLITVSARFGKAVHIANSYPHSYDNVYVSGYPGLLPNVVSSGHVSGRRIIQVLTGFRKCTDEDKKGVGALFCIFFGGIPEIRNYESVLVTATIMPGSSGSGVYNANEELIGVVFAGQGDFGYAWIVPYEQVLQFLYAESKSLPVLLPSQMVKFGSEEPESKRSVYEKARRACSKRTNKRDVINICKLLSRDMIWRKN